MSRALLAPVSYVSAGAVLIGLYLVHPPSPNAEWLVAAAPALAAIAIVAAVVSHRPEPAMPWLLLAAGLLVLVVAHAAAAREHFMGDAIATPGAATAIGLLAVPPFLVATICITSDRRSDGLFAGTEPTMYVLALTTVAWVLVTAPYLDGGRPPGDRAVWIALMPLTGLSLAATALRGRRLGRWGREVSVLVLGFVALGASHGLVAWAIGADRHEPGTPIAGSVMIGPLIVGLAGVAPRWWQTTGGSGGPLRASWVQFVGLWLVASLPVAALIIVVLSGDPPLSAVVVAAAAAAAVTALALGRMWWLAGQVRVLVEQSSSDRLAVMVEHATDVVMLSDPSGRVSHASPGLRTTLGYEPQRWPGRYLFDLVVEAERDVALGHFARVNAAGHGATVDFETTVIHADGGRRRTTVAAANLVGGVPVDGIVVTFRDVTAQRDLERRLEHRANHDELTGLANRAMFLDRTDHALRVARPAADPVGLLFFDLDGFKSVNDALGHAVGDELLREVADRIRSVIGPGDTAGRLGGDEFAILLEDRGGIARATAIAEALLDSMLNPLSLAGDEVSVLASIGVALAGPATTTAALLRGADVAMYEAKRAGKGQFRIYDPAMEVAATARREYRNDLAEALDRGQLRLVFLPYVDLRSFQVTGAEALVRWRHPRRGDVAPDEFIPLAERSGMIVPIGYWVIEQVMIETRRWRPGPFVSLNLSPMQLRQPDFVERVVGLATRHAYDPGTMMIEINESVLVNEAARASSAIERLGAEGFKIAIDDFGSGYSSLTQLQRQPIDLLKIDPVATAEMAAGTGDRALGSTILQTTASLGILTAAEGIETAAQLDALRRSGCDLGQGFLLSPPLEADDIAARLGAAIATA